MSLVKCPECGKEVSDQANSCPNCGCPLKEEKNAKKKTTIEKGSIVKGLKKHKGKAILILLLLLTPIYEIYGLVSGEFSIGLTGLCLCMATIIPAVIIIKDLQREQNGVEKINKKTKIIVVGACVVLFLGAGSYNMYQADQYEKEQQAEQQAEEKYITDMKDAVSTMRSDADDANDLCELTMKVWYNAIYKESSSETDEYTKKNGSFVSDFNDALGSLYTDKTGDYTTLNIHMKNLSNKMGEFRNPPQQYEDCYKEFTSTFAAYKSLINLTVDYNGSYNSVSSDMREKENAFEEAYNKLIAVLPTEEE